MLLKYLLLRVLYLRAYSKKNLIMHGFTVSANLYGGLGLCLQWGPGVKPLVRSSGGFKLERFLFFSH